MLHFGADCPYFVRVRAKAALISLLLFALLFAGINVLSIGVAFAQEQQPRTFRVPFHSVNNVFFWLLLGLATAGTVWFLAGIVRVFITEEFRRDVDRLRKLRDQRRSKRGKRGKHLLGLLALVALLTVTLLLFFGLAFPSLVSAQEQQPRIFRIPFREVNHRILVDVKVDDRPATLLFDTGARASVLLGTVGYDFQLHLKHGKFFSGGETNVAFQKAEVHFDGFLGTDIISKFASVAIDYTNHVIVFTEKP